MAMLDCDSMAPVNVIISAYSRGFVRYSLPLGVPEVPCNWHREIRHSVLRAERLTDVKHILAIESGLGRITSVKFTFPNSSTTTCERRPGTERRGLTLSHVHQLDVFVLGKRRQSALFSSVHVIHDHYNLQSRKVRNVAQEKRDVISGSEHDTQFGVVDSA